MKFLRQLPLARKLILTMMATSSVALLVACLFFLSYDLITLRHNVAEHLKGLAGITGANVTAALIYDDPRSADLVLRALQSEPYIVAARIYDGHRRVFASYRRNLSSPVVPLPDLPPALGSRLEPEHVTECHPIILDGDVIGSLYLVSDLQELQVRRRRFLIFVFLLTVVSSTVALFVAILLKRVIARPILELVETTKTVSREKNFAVRASKHVDDELGLLVDGFNEMLAEIEFAEDALRAAHAESELFINSVPSILIGTDSLGKITRWNLAAETVFALPANAVLGKPLQNCGIKWLHSQPDAQGDSWFRVTKSEKRDNVTFERDGHPRFLGLTISNVLLLPRKRYGISHYRRRRNRTQDPGRATAPIPETRGYRTAGRRYRS